MLGTRDDDSTVTYKTADGQHVLTFYADVVTKQIPLLPGVRVITDNSSATIDDSLDGVTVTPSGGRGTQTLFDVEAALPAVLN